MKVAIHQPNFFPWWPFFQKMASADVFVILRHCQFEKNNFQNRFQYDNRWMTMSIHNGIEPILNKKYLNPKKDWEKIKAKIPDKKDFLSSFDDLIYDSLWETNYHLISRLSQIFEIKSKIVLDEPTSLKSTERLVDICKNLGASEYISGSGGKKYLDVSLFEQSSIKVTFQDVKDEDKIHVLDKV